MPDVLFVGGPADGKLVAMRYLAPVYNVMIPPELTVSLGDKDVSETTEIVRDHYELEAIHVGLEKMHLYRHHDLSMKEAIQMLFFGYRQPKREAA